MALADTAKLVVDLSLKGNFASQLSTSQKALANFDKQVATTGSRAYKAGTQIGTGLKNSAYIAAGAIGFLASQVGLGLKSLSELESITTQTNAVLKSTKGVAGQTATSIRALAEEYESLNATIDDKVIQSGENLLLTFTNIRKEAFEPALKAALDMNTALGRGESGLQGTIQQLGVALNDPIRGLTRLQRAGITFTKAQKEAIVAAVEAGDTFKAQGIILAELNKRYGGSFLAGGSTTTGKIAKFKDAIEDLQRALATALLPTLGKVADALSSFLRDPAVIKGAQELGDSIASMFSSQNLAAAGDVLRSIFLTAKAAAPVVVEAAKAMAGIVGSAVSVFRSLPPEIQKLAIGAFAINKITGGLVTNIAGGLISSVLKQLVSGVVNVNGAVVNVNGPAGLAGVPGGGGPGGILPVLGKVVTKLAGLALVFGGLSALNAGVQQGGPAGAGIGALGAGATIGGAALLLGPLGAIAASAGVVVKTLFDIRDTSKGQADEIANSIKNQISGGAKLADLKTSLAAVETGINDIQANPLNVLLAGDALDELRAQRALLQSQVANQIGTEAAINTAARQGQAQSADIRQAINNDRLATVGKLASLAVGTSVLAARTVSAMRAVGLAAKAGGLAAAAAIKAQKLSVKITVPISNTVRVNARDVTSSQKTISKYFVVAS